MGKKGKTWQNRVKHWKSEENGKTGGNIGKQEEHIGKHGKTQENRGKHRKYIKYQQVHSNNPMSGAGSPSCRAGSVQLNL